MSVTKSTLDTAAVEIFGKTLRGELLDPTHHDYEAMRRVYNAMIDKRPALIARCLDVADVIVPGHDEPFFRTTGGPAGRRF